MELFIIWILFGVASAIVASNKGLNGCGWLIIGFLLGPFGLILALVVSKNQKAIDKEFMLSGQFKKCPFCAELIRPEAVKCRFCGSDLTTSKQSEIAAGSVVGSSIPTEPKINPAPPMLQQSKQLTPEEMARISKQNNIALAVIGVCIIAFFVFVGINHSPKHLDKIPSTSSNPIAPKSTTLNRHSSEKLNCYEVANRVLDRPLDLFPTVDSLAEEMRRTGQCN